MQPKLFVVEKWLHHEYGKSELLSTQYFLANQLETVKSIILERVGWLSHWYSYDRCEEKYQITEAEVEIL